MKTVLGMEDLHFEADGSVWARPYLGYDRARRRAIRPYRKLAAGDFADAADALAKMNEWWDAQRPAGRHGVPATVSGLLDAWLRSSAKSWKPGGNTARDYRSKVDNYVVPYLGSMQARDVDPPMVDDLYDALLSSGGRSGSGISPNTVRSVHFILRQAWRWAVARGMADYNPIDYVAKPRPSEHEATAFSRADVAALMRAFESSFGEGAAMPAKGDARGIRDVNMLFCAYLSLMTGLRLGEACALESRDVRATGAGTELHVGATVVESHGQPRRVESPKSAKSRRNVPLAPQAADALRRVRGWQRGYLGARASRSDMPLCPAAGSAPMRPSAVSRRFSKLRDELGLPAEASFHSLRHTFATWQLEAGAPVHEVSALLGHANEEITLRVYAHVMPGRGAASVRGYAEMIGEAADAGEV